MIEFSTNTQLGIGFASFGLAFIFLGVIFFFDKGLLAIGNILFITGLSLVIGPKRTFFFFIQRDRLKGSLAFFAGIFIVLMGHPIVGALIELVGFYLLFKSYVPQAFSYLFSMIPFFSGYAKSTSVV